MRAGLQVLIFALGGNLALASNPFPSANPDVVENLEHYWSYGRSPAVYPSPPGEGTNDWSDAYIKAKHLVSQMTNEEKSNLTYGFSSKTNGCAGNTGSIPRLGFPGICLQDAESGVRGTDMVNAYPAGLHAGASWNRHLAYKRAQHIGAEFRRKGINVVLGPVAGPLGRMVRGGRNWEGFAADPYLSGRMLYHSVVGIQENAIACVKHLIANEQETDRRPPGDIKAYNQSVSSNLDDKTMHELYLWGFQDAVKAGVGSVMCSYNRINNSYACQNSKVMNGLLKTELGFQGFVVSDWSAVYGGIAGANAGLDMVMPDAKLWVNGTLDRAVKNGSMTQTRLDDMATRILASWYRYAEIDNPGHGMPVSLLEPHDLVDGRDPDSKPTILQSAIEGHVLLKNERNVLPLNKPRFISLFGYDAVAQGLNMQRPWSFNYWVWGLGNTQSYPDRVFKNTTIEDFLDGDGAADLRSPGAALNGTLFTGGGSGATTPSYIDAPFNAFQQRAIDDNTWLSWDFISQNPSVNPATEACVVFINEQSSEGADRPYLADPGSDNLVENVASKCNNTMVVIHNAGIRLVDRWIENPNVTAVIYGHVPGQDSGRALVNIMYGEQSPSGRLPYTVAKRESDYGHLLNPTMPDNTSMFYTQANFTEGVHIDYRHFLTANITPRFEFGYGLTYTSFKYSNLNIDLKDDANIAYMPGSQPANSTTPAPEGGLDSLWDVLANVSCSITNTGDVPAAEVAQLYLNIPGNGQERVLRGFDKQMVQPGETVDVSFELTRRDLSTWDVTSQNWVLPRGQYGVMVGKSVLDIQLQKSLQMGD
ncbi:hypothetical protein PHISCL_04548 [Aspergillus sclerotialis]|uniref:beta-glucosidase n=1 Tax=Aspergillus sclerotialis TaxID=2070753 RepID=A0A3A3A1A4_9EURO|nr:hypothetical protein PHISCL_04548 [Aspergillus sclerotialis]